MMRRSSASVRFFLTKYDWEDVRSRPLYQHISLSQWSFMMLLATSSRASIPRQDGIISSCGVVPLIRLYDKAGKTGFRRASSVGKCPPIELWYNAGRESWVNDPSWVGRVPESRLEWK